MLDRRDLKKRLIAAAFILALPLPSLFWLPKGSVLAHGPVYPWPDAAGLFDISTGHLFAWVESSGFGGPNTEPAGFLFYLYAGALSFLFGDTHLAQSFSLYLGYAGCMAGAYFLSRTLGLGRTPSLAAAGVYILNPIIFSGMPTEPLNPRLLPYHAGAPVVLAIAVRVINGEALRKNIALFAIAALFLGSPGYSSLQYFVLQLFLIAIYSACRLLREEGGEWAGTAMRTALVLLVFFMINMYWLGLFLFDLGDAYASRLEPGFSDADLLRGFGLDFINGLMMLPVPELSNSFPWVAEYYRTATLAALFFFVSIAGLSFLSKEGREKAIFPGMAAALSLFLAKGTKAPFDSLGEAIFLSHPYITRLFRNPSYFELVTVLAFSLLMGIGTGLVMKKARAHSFKAAAAAMATLAASGIIYGRPFFSGSVIESGEKALSSQFNYVPDYYLELSSALRNDEETSRIMAVPAFTRQDWFVAYGWERSFLGGQFLNLWSGKPLIRSIYPGSAGVNPLFDSAMSPELAFISPEAWLWLMRVGGVKYVTLHGDTDTKLLRSYDKRLGDTEGIYRFIRNSPHIEKTGDFGPIELYALRSGLRLPKVYASDGFDLVEEMPFEESLPLLSFISSRERPLIAFSMQQPPGVLEKIKASGLVRGVLAPSDTLSVKSYASPSSLTESKSAVSSFVISAPGGFQKSRVFYDTDPGEYKKISFPGGEGQARLSVAVMPKYRAFAFNEDFTAAARNFETTGKLLSLYAPEDDGTGAQFPDDRFRAVRSGGKISVINHSAKTAVADLGLALMPLSETEEIRAYINGRESISDNGNSQIGALAPVELEIKGVLLFPGSNELRIYLKEPGPPDEKMARPIFGLGRLLRISVLEKDLEFPEDGVIERPLSASPEGIGFLPGARCVDGYLASFARDVGMADLERFPIFSMEYALEAHPGQGIEVSFMLDTNGDGKADASISKALRARASGRPERSRTDVMGLLRTHMPDQKKAYLTTVGFMAHCDDSERPGNAEAPGPGFRLRSIGLFSRQSEKTKVPLDWEPPVIKANGESVPMESHEGGLFFSADLPSPKGMQNLEVFETDVAGVYSISVEPEPLIAPVSGSAQNAPGTEGGGPLLRFERINPARYMVHVRGADKGFALAFLEAYHPGWRAYIGVPGRGDSGSILVERLRSRGARELDSHFVANGYANGWLVPDETVGDGEFTIIMEFRPQMSMEAGLLLSAAGLISVLAFSLAGRKAGR
ncbi:MAG: hypothetical protein H3C68_06730 [Deltaproteobacteria bacterium]|nr:hypothetical protein [Deltaproteobacteria bacterium]MBZ0219549.1 hypothetical protein [Deltaproteobacteria bacterium]